MQGTGDVNVHDLHHKSHLLIRHSKQTISMNTKSGFTSWLKVWQKIGFHIFQKKRIDHMCFQKQISLKTFVAQSSFSDMGVNGKTSLGT